ncbi:hypothetical protein H0N99_02400 [Candidatus Micrarchaeota archaeon]|nr:hypothetical protein [Candidatus Micrarchaeota archaeon]
MKPGRPVVNYLFVLLPLLLLSSASYASMGDISICFPFFLLLAFLMAAMIAQGKSPLVGFDISTKKPPAEIKSTSYHVRSYTSGGFDTVSKRRDQAGGGTHLTRGAGWVANKLAQGGAKVVSKATGEKYGSEKAKEGIGALKNMSQRGLLHTISRGRLGGGELGTVERTKKEMQPKTTETVKSLRQMLGFGLATTAVLSQKENRVKELENKKKKTVDEKAELRRLRDEVKLAAPIKIKNEQLTKLEAKEKKGTTTPEEAKRLISLRTELQSLEDRYTKQGLHEKKFDLLSRQINDEQKMLAAVKHRERELKAEIGALDKVGSAKGRITMMASPFAFAVGGAGVAGQLGWRSFSKSREKAKLKKEVGADADRPMTANEQKELRRLNTKFKRSERGKGEKLTDKEKSDRNDLARRARYLELRDRPSMISSILNPSRLTKRELLGLYARANLEGAKRAVLDIAPLYYGAKVVNWNAERKKNKAKNKINDKAPKLINEINAGIAGLKNPLPDKPPQKTLQELDKKFKELEKMIGSMSPENARRIENSLSEKMLSADKGKLVDAINELSTASNGLAGLYKDKEIGEISKGIEEAKKSKDTKKQKELEEKLNAKLKQRDDARENVRKKADDLMLALFGPLGLEKLEKKGVVLSDEQKDKVKKDVERIEKEISAKDKQFNDDIAAKQREKRQNNKELDRVIKEQREKKYTDPARAKELEKRKKQLKTANNEIDKKIKDLQANWVEAIGGIIKDKTSGDKLGAYGLGLLEKFELDRNKEARKSIKPDWLHKSLYNISDEKQQKNLATNFAMMRDLYDQGVESGSPFAKMLKFSFKPLAQTQELRHIESTIENISGPMWAELQRQRAIQARLTRELNQSATFPERASKTGEASREYRLAQANENINKLLNSFMYQDALLMQRQMEDQRVENKKEVRKIDKTISKDNRELDTLKKSMYSMSYEETYNKDYRNLKDQMKELERRNEMTTPEYTKLMNSAIEMEDKREHYTSQYKKLLNQYDAVNASIEGKEKERNKLTSGREEKTAKLRAELHGTADLTRVKVGGEEIQKDRDRIRYEFRMQEAYKDSNIIHLNSDSYSVHVINKMLHGDKEDTDKLAAYYNGDKLHDELKKLKEYENPTPDKDAVSIINNKLHDGKEDTDKLAAYYASHKTEYKKDLEESLTRLKTEYMEDLKKSLKELKEKWDGLKTVNYSDFLGELMKESGDPRIGREKGLNRELLEYNKLLEIYDNKQLQDTKLNFKEFGYEMTPEFREYLNRKINRINSELYTNTLAMAGVIPVGEALDIHKKFQELNERDDAVNAAYAGQAQKLIIKANKDELEDDKRRGWDAEVKRIKQVINEQNDKLKKIVPDMLGDWDAIHTEEKQKGPKTAKSLDTWIQKLEGKRDLARAVGDLGEVSRLDRQIDRNKFIKEENDFTKTSHMYRLSMLLHREKSEEANIVSAEALAEHRNAPTQLVKSGWSEAGRVITRQAKDEQSARELAEREKEIRSRKHLTNEEKEKLIRELPRKDLIRSFIQNETINELNIFRQMYPEETNKKMWENAMERADAQYLDKLKDMVTKLENQSEIILEKHKDALVEKKKQINEISEGIKQLEVGQKKLAKLANDPNEAWRYEEVQNSLNVLHDKKTNALKEFKSLYNDWKGYQIEHRSVFEPDRTKELFRQKSEEKEGDYFRELRSDLEENMYGGRFAPATGFVSKVVQKVEYAYKRGGGNALVATAILAPLAMPVVGPFISLGVSLGAAGVYGGKTITRKGGEWEEHMAPGSKIHKVTEWVQSYTPWSSGFDAVARGVYHASRFAPHLTGRGSGAPPAEYSKVWASQMTGTAYLTKGFRVNKFGEVEPNKQKLSIPYEGLPWFIRVAKEPFENVGAVLSSHVRFNTLWWMHHEGARNFAKYIKQNPNIIPEVEEGIQYQYAKLFGSIEPMIHPKQANEMTEYKAVALSMPYQEQFKTAILPKKFGYKPMADDTKRYEDIQLRANRDLIKKVSDSAVKWRKDIKYNIRGEIGEST